MDALTQLLQFLALVRGTHAHGPELMSGSFCHVQAWRPIVFNAFSRGTDVYSFNCSTLNPVAEACLSSFCRRTTNTTLNLPLNRARLSSSGPVRRSASRRAAGA